MSTKFYFLIKDTEPEYFNAGASWPSHGWGNIGIYGNYGNLIDPIKMGLPSVHTTITESTGIPLNPLFYIGVSRRLMPQTISGTLDMVFYAGELAAADAYTRLVVYITDTTGSPFTPPVKGYLVSPYEESAGGGGIEWSSPNIEFAASRRLQAPITITPYTIPNDGRDYRIVVEFGCRAYHSVPGSISMGTRLGGRVSTDYSQAPDLIVSSTYVIGAPYIEFSADIALKSLTYPVNSEPEGAIDIGAGPQPVVPIAHAVRPNPYEWFKYSQNNTTDRVISALFCGPGTPTSNYANLYNYSEITPGSNGPPFFIGSTSIQSNSKRPTQVPTKPGGDAYFRVSLSGGIGGGNTGAISVVDGPVDTVQPGDLFDTPDSSLPNLYDPTLPGGSSAGIFFNPNGTIRYATNKHIATELGVSLANGKFALADLNNNNQIIIYDKAPSLNELVRASFVSTGDITSIATDFINFYVLMDSGTNTRVYKISETGVVDPLIRVIPGNYSGSGLYSSAVSRDGNYLYYENTASIGRFDLINNISLTSIPTSIYPNDIIVLKDNTIIVDIGDVVTHMNHDGTILHTFDTGTFMDHLTHEHDDSIDKVWIWLQPGGSINRFQLINFYTGTIIKTFDSPIFLSSGLGNYDSTGACNPTNRFGGGSSCPLLMMMTPSSVEPPLSDISGIYFINPAKFHDTYYGGIELKIPNPTIKTALIGE